MNKQNRRKPVNENAREAHIDAEACTYAHTEIP